MIPIAAVPHRPTSFRQTRPTRSGPTTTTTARARPREQARHSAARCCWHNRPSPPTGLDGGERAPLERRRRRRHRRRHHASPGARPRRQTRRERRPHRRRQHTSPSGRPSSGQTTSPGRFTRLDTARPSRLPPRCSSIRKCVSMTGRRTAAASGLTSPKRPSPTSKCRSAACACTRRRSDRAEAKALPMQRRRSPTALDGVRGRSGGPSIPENPRTLARSAHQFLPTSQGCVCLPYKHHGTRGSCAVWNFALAPAQA